MSKGWDNATLKKLKSLMGKGLSTAEIGKRLGLSKNAVVGKLNRLGWNSKSTANDETKKKAPAAKKPAPKATTAKKTATTASRSTAAKPAKTAQVTKKATAPKATKTTTAAKSAATPAKKTAPEKKTTATDKKSLSKTLAMHQRIIQHSLEMANLKPNQCRWPIGDPDSENFHFCGEQVFVGKPYCYEHCRQAYQFTPPKKK